MLNIRGFSFLGSQNYALLADPSCLSVEDVDMCGYLLKDFLLTLGIIMHMRKLSPSGVLCLRSTTLQILPLLPRRLVLKQRATSTQTVKESEICLAFTQFLKRNNQKEKSKDAGKSDPSYPPGFTPKGVNETIEEEENGVRGTLDSSFLEANALFRIYHLKITRKKIIVGFTIKP
ncbi:hypothetical protein Tco_1428256 [Tanacetum coccineum]